jgi:phosphatidylethanolamine-binding protein (PEBP) family uncharacterized protein
MKRLHCRRRYVTLAALLVLTACRSDGKTLEAPRFPPPDPPTPSTGAPSASDDAVAPAFQLFAPWPDGSAIPVRYTCDGDGVPPALTWAGVPAAAVELTLTATDLDDDLHSLWIVDRIPASQSGMAEGEVPFGAIERLNSDGTTVWEAPCPSPGEERSYLFTLHALNQPLEAADTASANEVIDLLNSVAIDQTSVSGRVAREG